MSLTPCDLDVLLHYYVSPAQHSNFNTPAVQESIQTLRDGGLLDDYDYTVTPKGRVHIAQLLALPLPRQAWIGYDGSAIPDPFEV